MLTLREHKDVQTITEAWYTDYVPAEVIDKTDYYDLKYNPVSDKTVVEFFDAERNPLGSIAFETPEGALAYVETQFELDDEDIAYNDSYDWADDDDEVGPE